MRIAITGALGSLGRRLVFYAIRHMQAEKVMAYGRNEFMIAQHQDLLRRFLSPAEYERVHWVCGDIRDQSRMEKAFWGCHLVVHAAALKRVDSSLDNPSELKQTNIDGVMMALEAAMKCGVRQFIFISSDKAVMPENIYGASKMLGEELVKSFNAYSSPQGTICHVVRYGNVLGSRGSVLWLWLRAITQCQPIMFTSHQMSRYFLDFHSAIRAIESAYLSGRPGQTLIPYCGSYLLVDFYAALHRALGKEVPPLPAEGGLRRGGEKIHESLCTPHERGTGSVLNMQGHDYLAFPSAHREALDLDCLLSSRIDEELDGKSGRYRVTQETLKESIMKVIGDPFSQFDFMD